MKFAPNTYSVCSPVWRLTSTGQKGVFHENAAFNAMLTDGAGPNNPLIMHAGDTITVHQVYHASPGRLSCDRHLTTHGSDTIVLNSSNSGPLMPAFDTQTIGNALGWGAVFDTPNSFVWEIGHESVFTAKGRLRELFACADRSAASLMMPRVGRHLSHSNPLRHFRRRLSSKRMGGRRRLGREG